MIEERKQPPTFYRLGISGRIDTLITEYRIGVANGLANRC